MENLIQALKDKVTEVRDTVVGKADKAKVEELYETIDTLFANLPMNEPVSEEPLEEFVFETRLQQIGRKLAELKKQGE